MFRIFTLCLCIYTALFSTAWAQDTLQINAMRFGQQEDERTRIVLELNKNADFKTYLKNDPPRLILELPVFDWKIQNNSLKPPAFISEIKFTTSRNKHHSIALHLDDFYIIDSAFLLPAKSKKPTRLVIDLAQANRLTFKQHINIPHGTLSNKDAQKQQIQTTPKTIVIDPGHGGHDPGAVGVNKLKEKDVALKASKILKQLIEENTPHTVYLTRETDIFIPLYDRIAIAHQHNADLFISLHADSISDENIRGASLYTLSDKATDAQTEALAIRENKAGLMDELGLPTEDEAIASILVDLAYHDTSSHSEFLASSIKNSILDAKIRTLPTPHRQAGFAVLKAPDIPSILIEMGFMSNKKDAKTLSETKYLKKISNSILDGISSYFEQLSSQE